MCMLIASANTQSSSGGKGELNSLELLYCLPSSTLSSYPLLPELFPANFSKKKLLPWSGGTSIPQLAFCRLSTARRGKKIKSYQKGFAPSAASGSPAAAKQLAAAAALKPVLLCCFTRGKSVGA